MPFSNSVINTFLDAQLDSNAYLGLFTTMPTSPSGSGTEMSAGAYARTDISANFSPAASRSKTTDIASEVTTGTGTVLGWGIWDAASAGNLKCYDEITTAVSLESNVFATTGEGTDVITLANADVRNVVVKNNAESVTYTEGTDYYVQYESGKIVRISTGGISSGDTVKVSYDYPTSRAFTTTDIARFAIGTLTVTMKSFK